MALDVRMRSSEGCDPQPALLWDSTWFSAAGRADWALAEADEALNRGGLRARAALHTAVVLALFTNRRVPETHPLHRFVDGDPGGWWGDGIDVRGDLGEEPLGSYLHALERAPLTEETRRWAEACAAEALQPLIKQRVCVRIEVQAVIAEAFGRLELLIQLYGRDGQRIYDARFGDVWGQAQR